MRIMEFEFPYLSKGRHSGKYRLIGCDHTKLFGRITDDKELVASWNRWCGDQFRIVSKDRHYSADDEMIAMERLRIDA